MGIEAVLTNRRMLLGFDTGTGKTFTYAAVVRALLNRDREKKHILVIINDSITQVPRDLRNLTDVPVMAFDGSAQTPDKLEFCWERTSIFVLTLEAFRNIDVAYFLFQHLPEIESFSIDEAHHVSNWDTSNTAFMIRTLAQYAPYIVELSATPMTRESRQYYRLMNILDRNINQRRNEAYLGKYVDRYLPINRQDYDIKGNYISTLVTVEPTMEQMKEQHGIIFRKLKGTGAAPQIKALVETVQERLARGKRVIVYVRYHDTRHWVEENFSEQEISFVSVHGRITKKSEKQEILDTFRNGGADVLITSVTESLNIEADCVIFYEFTTLAKQVIGRAHRGLAGKELEIVFILTKNSDEVGFFLKYIYERSLTIQRLLGKDYSELVAIGDEIKRLDLE